MSKHVPHIQRAIAHAGTQTELARRAGVTRPAIAKLLSTQSISGDMCAKIERATDGAVTRHDLRPDLWPENPAARA